MHVLGSTNSILLSPVFIRLLPDLSSAYCPRSPVCLLSLKHASGRGLLLIGHRPLVPTGRRGSDALPETHRQRRLSGCVWALQTQPCNSPDRLADPAVRAKRARFVLDWCWRFISERQVYCNTVIYIDTCTRTELLRPLFNAYIIICTLIHVNSLWAALSSAGTSGSNH